MHTGLYKERITKWLGSKYYPLFLVLLTFVLTAPTLWGGLALDDYIQKSSYLGFNVKPGTASPLGLFTFLNGDPGETRKMMETGGVAWWAGSNLKIKFMRPITELSHLLDYTLWLDYPVFMHLHSNIWYMLLVFLVTLLYRRFLGHTVTAGLAALLFAIASIHTSSIGWLASRSSLIVTVFSIGVLMAHGPMARKRK